MKQSKRLSADELFTYSVKKLSGRASSLGEIRTALLARASQPADVDEVLARLKSCGYLNDAQFAESFASARLANGGLGQSRVLRELRQRRVASELAQSTVSRIYANQDETVLIEQYLRRKYRLSDREVVLQSEKEVAGAYRRLLRAGFTPGNSIRVLKRFAANPELFDAIEEPPPEEP